MRTPVDIAVIGAGNRGYKYLTLLAQMPEYVRIAAIVEPDSLRARHALKISDTATVYQSLEEMLSQYVPAAAIIATPEQLHHTQAMALLDRKVNILVEKPLAVTLEQCREIAGRARELGVIAGVCHVLRYHPYYSALIDLATSGTLGEVVSVTHRLNVGIDRACHTFVRGPWGIPSLTSPMILSKGCHDMDLIVSIIGSRATQVYSVGGKHFFTHKNKPAHATDRCIDCQCEAGCRFSAVDLYARRKEWIDGFIPEEGETSDNAIERELRGGRYGRCVFACDNEAVDRQIITVAFENGAVATLTMNLFTAGDTRDTHITLTGGEIHGTGTKIEITPLSSEPKILDFENIADAPYHAGADKAVLADFIEAIVNPNHRLRCSIEDILESHRICLLASIL